MKKRPLSLSSPGSFNHAWISPLPIASSGCSIVPKATEIGKQDAEFGDGSQLIESQSKHPFLSRTCQPYSSQSQRESQQSLPQGCLTQSQNTQRWSQNSQPEDQDIDRWRRVVHDKQIVGQQKPPSPYFAGLTTSNLARRDGTGNLGGGQKAGSSTSSSALCLVGPQSSTPRPWPHCNVSEELEKRLGNLEKLREEETALLQNLRDDYQQLKTFLEETCFESKDNRSKLSLQQNALHKLLKEEEAANNNILAVTKASGERILQEIKNLQQGEQDAAIENNTANLKVLTETFREELANFKREIKSSLDAIEKAAPLSGQQQLASRTSQIQNDTLKRISEDSLVRSDREVKNPDIVDLDELPDSDFDNDLGFLQAPDASCSYNKVAKTDNLFDTDPLDNSDEDLRRSVQRKMLRAQRRIRCKVAN